MAPDEWDRLWFRPVTRDAFVDQEDSQGRYTLKPAFKSSFVPGVERVLMIPEVSQYLSFVAFLFDFVQTGAERAVFLEDDFNFIPIVDNQVSSSQRGQLRKRSGFPKQTPFSPSAKTVG